MNEENWWVFFSTQKGDNRCWQPRTWRAHHRWFLLLSPSQPCEEIIITLSFQMNKLRLRKGRQFLQGHTARLFRSSQAENRAEGTQLAVKWSFGDTLKIHCLGPVSYLRAPVLQCARPTLLSWHALSPKCVPFKGTELSFTSLWFPGFSWASSNQLT